MLNRIFDACHFLLYNYPNAKNTLEYLEGRIEPNDDFPFGYFPNTTHLSSLTSLVGIEILQKSNLISPGCQNKCTFNYFEDHPLIMPYRDPYGKIVALIGRNLLSENKRNEAKISKYKNTIFKKGQYLFGLSQHKQAILEQDCVYIVEGQFDLIKAHSYGLKNMVALGNSHLTDYQFSVITRYTSNLYLLLDNDQAGKRGRDLAEKKFGNLSYLKNYYVPPQYKDIDEYLCDIIVNGDRFSLLTSEP